MQVPHIYTLIISYHFNNIAYLAIYASLSAARLSGRHTNPPGFCIPTTGGLG
jgi:hypothetical protein